MFKNLWVPTLALLLLTACSKDELGPDEVLFGHFYGMCIGEACIEIFKISDDALLEDTTDQYPGNAEPYDGTFQMLPADRFEQVRDLRDQIPTELFEESERVIGAPDATDGGGYYLQARSSDGELHFWLMDTDKRRLPEYLHDFVDVLADYIQRAQG